MVDEGALDRRWWGAVLAVWAVGLTVRLVYTLAARPRVPGLSDATTYHLTANLLASGHGLIRPYDFFIGHLVHPTAEFPPLFPMVLSAGSWFGATSVLSHRVLTSVLGSATVIVVALLARRVAGPLIALIAAAIVALHPMLLGSDAIAMSETLDTLIVAAALLLCIRAIAAPSPWRWVLVGAALGAAVLTRGENLLLVALVAGPLAVRTTGGRRRWKPAGIIAATAFVVMLPWTVRNAITFKAFVPVADDSGGAISGSNCPPAYFGAQAGLWLYSCNTQLNVRGLDEAQAAARYRHQGLAYAQAHLTSVPRVVAIRVLRTWGLYRAGQQADYETLEGRIRGMQRAGQLLDWLLYLPAAVGAVVVLRRDRAVGWVLLAPVMLATMTAALTYGNERFRASTEPAVAILAVVGLTAVIRRARGSVAPAA